MVKRLRTSAVLCLFLAAPGTCAEGVKVAELAGTAYLVEPASIGEKGGVRTAAVIHDYAQPEPGNVRSRRVTYEIDCARERLRSVSGSEYPVPMAQGTPINAWQRESDWLYVVAPTGSNIAPRSPYRAVVRLVCSK